MVVIGDVVQALRNGNPLYRIAIGLFILTGLGSASWLMISKLGAPEMPSEAFDLLSVYRDQVIPSYKEKAVELVALQKELKSVDPHVSGILTHVPNWKADTLEEVKQIEELASHLDTHVSNWYLLNQTQIGRAEKSRTRWIKVVSLDRQLNATRQKLGLAISQN